MKNCELQTQQNVFNPLQSDWVACRDRMPSDERNEEWVLIISAWGEYAVAKKFWEQGYKPNCWMTNTYRRYEIEDVTHWMILPKRPN